MVENTFDPAHSPWTHEQMVGFGGMSFSPSDVVPMERYDIRTSPTIHGFSLEHTPYQNTTAQVTDCESLTVRAFYPPCTVSVSSPPFFQTKMWFVPARKYETNVLSFFRTPQTRLVKWTSRFPKLQEFVRDTQHTLQYVGDWNYRFLSQDRITMQGQDVRKAGKSLKDLTPDPSDRGVATFQYWLQRIAGGGPFAAAASVADISDAHNSPSLFSRELSFWESHGKYCPRCHNTMRRISITKKLAAKWSNRLMAASLVSALFAGALSVMTYRSSAAKLASFIAINLLVYSVGLRRLFDWSRQKENRMHKIGPDLWPPHVSVFGYQSNRKQQQRML